MIRYLIKLVRHKRPLVARYAQFRKTYQGVSLV